MRKSSAWLLILVVLFSSSGWLRVLGDVELSQEATFVNRYCPAENFGAKSSIELTANASNTHYGYIRWSLSQIPSTHLVTDAVIRLRKSYSFSNGTRAINLYQVSGDWSEGTLTWNVQPVVIDTVLATVSYPDTDLPGQPYTFSSSALTALVQQWVNDRAMNKGLQVRQSSTTGVLALYTDDAVTQWRPVMMVTWLGQTHLFEAGEGAYAAKAFPTANYGTATHMDITNHANTLRSYVKWDLSAIPAGVVIDSVSIIFYRAYGFHNTAAQIQVTQAASTWVEGNGGTDNAPSGEVRWDNQPGAIDPVLASVTFYDSDPAGTTYELRSDALKAVVQGWINGTVGKNGLRVQQTSTGVLALYSDDEENLSWRPELEVSPVTFTVAAPQGCSVTVDVCDVLEPVNRKVMGIGLMNASTPFSGVDFINAYTGVFDGVGGRAWACSLDASYWNSFWPFVTGVGLGNVNAFNSICTMTNSAIYTNSTSNNLASGQQPSAIADLVQILINNQHYQIGGWEVWNEPEVPQNGAWSAADFSRYVADCAEALRAKVPGLRIGGPLYENNEQWSEDFLEAMAAQPANRQIDFAVTHPYDFFWQQSQKNMGSYYARVSGAEPLRLWRLRPKMDLLRLIRPDWGLVASEWNIHPVDYNPPYNISTDMAVAIHAAAMFGVFWEEGVESAQFFQFIRANEGHFAMVQGGTPDGQMPVGHVFQLYGKYFRGERLNALLTTPSYWYRHPYMTETLSVPVVVAHAAYDATGQNLCMVFANRHQDAAAAVAVNLKNFLPNGTTGTWITITADAAESTVATKTINTAYPIPGTYEPSFMVTVPAHAVAALVIGGKRSEVISVTATKAAMVRQLYADRNYGSSLNVELIGGTGTNKQYGLVRWDLASCVEAGATVVDARLRISKRYDFTYTNATLSWREITSAWEEGAGDNSTALSGEVSWTAQPSTSSTILSSTTVYDADPDRTIYEFGGTGVTSLVQSWVNGTKVNYGIEARLSSPYVFSFSSDDDGSYAPQLILTIIR